MQTTITARDRSSLLAAALSKVDDADLRGAVDQLGAQPGIPRAVLNAGNALRRSRRVAATLVRPPYRTVLPYLATVVADECLARTIEILGDDSDDPSREQLLEAVETLRESFSDNVVGVMLVSVAVNAMPASDLCFEIATTDARFGLADWRPASDSPAGPEGTDGRPDADEPKTGTVASPENLDGDDADHDAPNPRPAPALQRAARKERRKTAAEDRRHRQETAERAAALVRSARKQERSGSSVDPSTPAAAEKRTVPTLVRQPSLTPAQQEEFDPTHALVGAIVYAWVPFEGDRDDDESPEGAAEVVDEPGQGAPGKTALTSGSDNLGKLRPCVVIGVARTHLLVRPGYSKGGRKSRDWTSVALRQWQEAGLDQPTWIGAETVRIPRPEILTPPRRLSFTDWNALW